MSTLPPEIAEAFTEAAITTLRELVQVEALPSAADTEAISGPVIVATIQLLRASPGSFSLVLPESVASQLATRYLPPGAQLTPEMIGDVAGEFANVIAGQAKTMLKGTNYHFNLSTPTIARVFHENSLSRNQSIRFSSEIGHVSLEIALGDFAANPSSSSSACN